LVTAIDAAYFPGLKALYNSYQANAGEGFEFYCMVHGDAELFAEVEALGIKAIHPPAWDTRYPTTAKWPEESAAMYARLLIPQMFNTERAIWLDADCIILKPLAPLLDIEFSEPVAAVTFKSENYTLGFHIPDLKEGRKVRVPFSGLLLFNNAEWKRRDITRQCADAMQDYDFRFVVQSVLGYVLKGDFHTLPYCWQVFAGRKAALPTDCRILHYVGALPWRVRMNNQHIWDSYAS
jgi:lipopolysaccharide biosynthesis glycosyltransferase